MRPCHPDRPDPEGHTHQVTLPVSVAARVRENTGFPTADSDNVHVNLDFSLSNYAFSRRACVDLDTFYN